jgi:hypothetical protein
LGDSRVTLPSGWVPGIRTSGSSFTGTGVQAYTAVAIAHSSARAVPKVLRALICTVLSDPLQGWHSLQYFPYYIYQYSIDELYFFDFNQYLVDFIWSRMALRICADPL